MNIYRKKKSVFNIHSAVRNRINLNNHQEIEQLFHNTHSVESTISTTLWLDQITEMKTLHQVASTPATKKTKLTIKWWEN